LSLPPMAAKVGPQMSKARQDIESKLIPSGPRVTRYLTLPAEGRSTEWILEEMANMDDYCHASGDKKVNWKDGKLSGAVYHGGEDMTSLIVSAYARYCVSNPLHPDVFPTVRKMEAEVVSMCLRMFNNPTGAGTMTSGGTESIIMSVKAHRDWAKSAKGITEPEMIVPASAHAAFDKGAAYLKIKVHTIPVDPITRKVDLKRVKRAINANTIMLVGSAPNFADGAVDDITGLGKLAKQYNLGLHVDCCLGSFIVPFIERAFPASERDGYVMPDFDFRVEGVTAVSCDTHKYGFSPKGTSVIMYRSPELRKFQYYLNAEWPGGVYASPSISGSRPGALIAGTWAAMQYMGENGYLDSCRTIVKTTRKIAHAIRTEIPELYVLGNPPVTVVAFGSLDPAVKALKVGDLMSKKGWHLNALQNPNAVHIACTKLTVSVADTFIADLKDAVAESKSYKGEEGTMVALYGLGQASPVGPHMVGELAASFLDALYKA